MFFTLATFVFRSNILIWKNFSQKSVKRFIDQIDHKMNKKYPSIRNWASAALPGNIIKNPLICLIWINIGQLIYHLELSSMGAPSVFFGNILTLENYFFFFYCHSKFTSQVVLWKNHFFQFFQLNAMTERTCNGDTSQQKSWLNTALT